MKPWIKTPLIVVIATCALIGSTAQAAVNCGKWERGGLSAWRDASVEEIKKCLDNRQELQLAKLELALVLTPEQKPAWDDFKKAAAANTATIVEGIEKMRKAGEPKTALDHLDRMEEANKQHARVLADTRKSVETFYSKLSAAQKTVFDAEFSKTAFRHGKTGGPSGRSGKRGGKKK
ncbi:MAG: Spy/CpxP family protein refolding chaperone [Azoarcus sp.]|nr:Spy/CpxP family protein refolding chaperone [Azoarcus sp.]